MLKTTIVWVIICLLGLGFIDQWAPSYLPVVVNLGKAWVLFNLGAYVWWFFYAKNKTV